MIDGGLSTNLSAERAASELRRLRPTDTVGSPVTRIAVELLDEVRDVDRALVELRQRIEARGVDGGNDGHRRARRRSDRAAYLIGYTGDISRFPTAGHYARYNATAPIEASSGPKARHRFNPNGNRQLNHAIHVAALTQITHDTPGRAYYLAKTDRREVTQRSDALPETTDQRRRLPTTPRRHQPLTENGVREDNQGRL